jgi:hypothetical protein
MALVGGAVDPLGFDERIALIDLGDVDDASKAAVAVVERGGVAELRALRRPPRA